MPWSMRSSTRSPASSTRLPAYSTRRSFTGLQPSTGVAGGVCNLGKMAWPVSPTAIRRYQICCRDDRLEPKRRIHPSRRSDPATGGETAITRRRAGLSSALLVHTVDGNAHHTGDLADRVISLTTNHRMHQRGTTGEGWTCSLRTTPMVLVSPRREATRSPKPNPHTESTHEVVHLDATHHHRRHAADGNPSRRG